MNAYISAEPITVSFQAALTAFNILCWTIPLRLKSFSQNQAVLSLANAFAGGIFLMLSFGHLLPEAVVTMERDSPGDGGVALVYTLVGYAAMLFIEKVAFTSSDNPTESKDVQNTHADRETAGQHGAETDRHLAGPVHYHSQQSAIALCCAMSIHSFFESAALGLARDATSMYMMAACIALHQPAESVALLVSFLKSGMSTGRIVMWLVGFSVVSLGGVAAGMLVKGLASGALEAVVMALTAGTFVYVGATEVRLPMSSMQRMEGTCSRFLFFILSTVAASYALCICVSYHSIA
jgi:zinc transporter 1/2/3